MTARLFFTLAPLLLTASLAGAEISPIPSQSQPPTSTTSKQPTPAPVLLAATAKQERFSGTVELYVTDWCGYCKKALAYVRKNNIKYVSYDIEKDAAAKQRYKEMGGHGVPFIVIGKNKMSGYSQENLEYYLNNPGQ